MLIQLYNYCFVNAYRENKRYEKQKNSEVAAALIWCDDRFLIYQKPPDKTGLLLYEFIEKLMSEVSK
ncbi:MAG TPA: hypothetical protein GXZ76_02960 [Clostridiaceae bacterium]|nr:hypothetical protein [Clostridiaceae bacterium]